jgi:hypothetical protein
MRRAPSSQATCARSGPQEICVPEQRKHIGTGTLRADPAGLWWIEK